MQKHWKRKKVIRHITDDLEIYSNDSDEKYIKNKYHNNIFWESNFENKVFERAILRRSFLMEQLW